MRDLPPAMTTAFAEGATTHCRCWLATRRDGARYGFTDHDRDLMVGGVLCRAGTGLEAAEAESQLGLAAGGGDVAGALIDDALTASDIDAGLWDGAAIESWLVDWRTPETALLIEQGTIGEIRREGARFTAEIRGGAHLLDQPTGRHYSSLCDAELGDVRCGVDLSGATRHAERSILAAPEPQTFTVNAPPGFLAGDFTLGRALFIGGANDGHEAGVLGHGRSGPIDRITLWSPPPHGLEIGATVRLIVGCDKRFDTCRERFGNAANFRGFPHIPGNDFLVSYARQGEAGLDGGALSP